MTNFSIETHKLCTGNVCNGLFGVYTCFRDLLDILDQISNDQIHQQVVNHYFYYKKSDSYGWCPNAKRQALAVLNGIMICLVCMGQDDNDQPSVTIKCYGEKSSLNQKCVYMLYDETKYTFTSLHVTDKKTQTETIKIYNYNDIMKNFLREYIENDLKYKGEINLDGNDDIDGNKLSIRTDNSNDTETISNSILQSVPIKRKESELDNIPMTSDNDIQLPVLISDEYYIPNKRVKVEETTTDSMSTFYQNNAETIKTTKLIQADDLRSESGIHDIKMKQQQTTDLPLVLKDEHQKQHAGDGKESDNKLDDSIKDDVEVNSSREPSKTNPLF